MSRGAGIGWGLLLATFALAFISLHPASAEEAKTPTGWLPAQTSAPLHIGALDAFDGSGAVRIPPPGHPVVLHFWATWCPPCIKELPEVNRLAGNLRLRGVPVYAISEDRGGAEAVWRFFQRHDATPQLRQLLDPEHGASQMLGVQYLPATVLVGADGKEIVRYVGNGHWDHEDNKNKLFSFFRVAAK